MHETSQGEKDLVCREDAGGITTLTLNRPTQFNALSEAMMRALWARLDEIAQDSSVRVVILRGAGKAFCAGHDLKEIRAHHTPAYVEALFTLCGQLMTKITRLPQPVIAGVHGIATAAGCQLVAACDLAVAEEGARFAVSGINVGLFCATPAVAVSRNMGRKHAMEMLLTGEFIDAHEACRRGLLNRVVEMSSLETALLGLAEKIAAKSAPAIAMGKQSFYRQLEEGLLDAYETTVASVVRMSQNEDFGLGVDAFIQKEAPVWKHR